MSSATNLTLCGLVSLLACLAATPLNAMSPMELRQAVENGEALTVIDVRPATLYQQGHIPNAINIPSVLIPQKDLPPVGRVVVYDEGLGKQTAAESAAILSKKPGIKADTLEGGFAAWEQTIFQTTAPPGLHAENLPMITYQNLKKTPGEDVVLVDLRKHPAPRATTNSASTPAADPAPFTDLQTEFQGASITRSAFSLPPRRQSGADPLLVLIDNGDGSARETARILRANGVKRFAILAGGEEIIVRKGRSGTQRTTFTVDPKKPGNVTGNADR